MQGNRLISRSTAARAVLLALSAVAGAEDGQADVDTLDEIVVTATRIETRVRDVARSITLIDEQRIQNGTRQMELAEILSGTPGLFLQNSNNYAQDLRISLRGFGARSSFGIRGVRIYVDDIPETLPDGQAQVDSIDIGSARSLEILRGPASSLYGNASGGVIVVRSELGEASPYAEIRGVGGDFGQRRYQLKSAGEVGAFRYLLSANHQETDGYRDQSAAEGDQVTGRIAFDVSERSRLTLSLNHTDQPVADDPGGITLAQATADPASARDRNIQFDTGESLSQQKMGAVFRHTTPTGELMLRNYYVWRDFNNRLPFTSGGAVGFERFFYGGGIQYRSVIKGLDDLTVVAGVDVDRQDDDRQRFDNLDGVVSDLVFDQNERVSAQGLYVHAQYPLGEAWSVSAGVRFDDLEFVVDDRFLLDGDDSGRYELQETSPSVGLNYAVGRSVFFAAVSTSFESPTSTELANPDGTGGFNESLRAQTARSIEFGYKTSADGLFMEFALFHLDIDDELVPFEVPAFPGRTFFANAGESTRQGVEAGLQWQSDTGLGAGLSITYSDFRFDRFVDDNGADFSGNRLPGVPRHLVYANIVFDRGAGWFGLAEATYAGGFFADNANATKTESYVVSNLRLGYRFDQGRWSSTVFLGINNLLDEFYFDNVRPNAFGDRYFEPAPPRNLYAGFSVRF